MSCAVRKGRTMFKRLSIKTKILVWFAIALLVIEAITLSLFVTVSRSVFTTDIQTQLMQRVDANAEEIEYYNSIKGQEIELGDQFISYGDGILEIDDDFCDNLNGIYTALIDEEGRLLYGECPIKLSKAQQFTFTDVGKVEYKGASYYVFERPLQGEQLTGLWLRGVISRREGISLLYTIFRLVLLLLPALAILAIIGGYIVTRRSLAPVQEIAAAAEKIEGAGDLSSRITLGPGDDELHRLARIFNNMFSRLEQSFAREKQFTSDASHELRTPTAVILAQCEYSLELAETEDDYRQALSVIQQQGQKMNELINQLLFFSRLQQGGQQLTLYKTDLSTLTEEVCADCAMLPIREAQQITLKTDIAPEMFIMADEGLLHRLLTNLITNSFTYGRVGGCTTVALQQENADFVLLTVTDNGIGIAPEDLPKIWDRFYQADPSRSRSAHTAPALTAESGAGLGLAMVKEIAALHHGEVSVESVPEQGSVFTVRLPLCSA